jgi:peptidoglycan/LPS O-acetylase OafA/YrhL
MVQQYPGSCLVVARAWHRNDGAGKRSLPARGADGSAPFVELARSGKVDQLPGVEFRIEDHALRLQATRGIAALFVTVGHCLLSFGNGRVENPTFLLSHETIVLSACQLTIQQISAVIFFYVLSGLVLSESLRRRSNFTRFAVRRVWRLVPVMWLSIAFALFARAAWTTTPYPGASPWFDGFVGDPLTTSEIVSDLTGLSAHANGVLWSVQVELAMIPLFPALWWLSRQLSLARNLILMVVLFGASILLWGRIPFWANAILYLHCFHGGILLPRLLNERAVRRVLESRAATAVAVLAGFVLHLLFLKGWMGLQYKVVANALISMQLLGFVICRASGWIVRALESRPLVWVGDVSYSFYAFSLSIQVTLASLAFGELDRPPGNLEATLFTFFLVLATTTLALLLAGISYRFVEIPCISVGERWSRMFGELTVRSSDLKPRSAQS